MGHVLEAMLDMHTDPTAVTSTFGCHVVLTEPDDILKHYKKTDEETIALKKEEILNFFDTPDPVSDPVTEKLTEKDLTEAARVTVALERFIEEKQLDGLAYYYEAEEGSQMRQLVTNLIVGNSLLISAGFPMCGEFDLKMLISILIMDRLDIGGSFCEFHPIDFNQGSVLVGHDGPHHLNIADGKPVLRSLKKYHGKPGSGASVEYRIKEGPITLLNITSDYDGKFKFIVTEGVSAKRAIPPTGNTNTHGHFEPDIRTFLRRWFAEGPTHHFAVGVGHHSETIRKIADVIGIQSVIV
jgi:L-arabinose isomerase